MSGEELRAIGKVKVGEWIQQDWKTWRQVQEITVSRIWAVYRLAGYPVECSCAPDVEFPWSHRIAAPAV